MSVADLNEWSVVVGEIVAPHGIRGEVQVRPLSENPGRFAPGSQVCLVPVSGERTLVEIGRARSHKRGFIVEVSTCDTRSRAEALRGATLTIHRSMRAQLPEGRYYRDDLLGVRVLTVTGEFIGTISEVLETGSNDVFVTERALIPATRQMVRKLDLDRKEMIVQPLPGLLGDDEG